MFKELPGSRKGGKRRLPSSPFPGDASLQQRIRNLENDPQNDRVSVDNCSLCSERDAGGKHRFVLPSAAFG